MVEVFALVVHDAVIVVVATLDPLAVPDAAVVDGAIVVVVAVATEVCAPSMIGLAVVVGCAFLRGGGVGGVNCRSIPS